MRIFVVGSEKRLISELDEKIKKKMNGMSAHTFFDLNKFVQNTNFNSIDFLIVEINTRNFRMCFQLVGEMLLKNPKMIIVFLYGYMLPYWRKKASDYEIILLDKNQETSQIVSQVLKIMRGDRMRVSDTELEFLTLTPREEEVLSHLSNGYTQLDIAKNLGVSKRTIQKHLTNIYEKMDTASQAELVKRAIELGIIAADYEVSEEF